MFDGISLNGRILGSMFDQSRSRMGGAASGAGTPMWETEICVTSLLLKNVLFGKWAEGSKKGGPKVRKWGSRFENEPVLSGESTFHLVYCLWESVHSYPVLLIEGRSHYVSVRSAWDRFVQNCWTLDLRMASELQNRRCACSAAALL